MGAQPKQKETIQRLRMQLQKMERVLLEKGSQQFLSSGSPEIDSLLPQGGFPRGALTELVGQEGEGTLSVALNAVALESRRKAVALVDGRGTFYALGMNQMGVDWRRFCVVCPPEQKRLVWTTQQLARSGLFSLIILVGRVEKEQRQGRGLLQAAEAGRSAVVLVGNTRPCIHFPCALRLHIQSTGECEREAVLLRARGGRVGESVRFARRA